MQEVTKATLFQTDVSTKKHFNADGKAFYISLTIKRVAILIEIGEHSIKNMYYNLLYLD